MVQVKVNQVLQKLYLAIVTSKMERGPKVTLLRNLLEDSEFLVLQHVLHLFHISIDGRCVKFEFLRSGQVVLDDTVSPYVANFFIVLRTVKNNRDFVFFRV